MFSSTTRFLRLREINWIKRRKHTEHTVTSQAYNFIARKYFQLRILLIYFRNLFLQSNYKTGKWKESNTFFKTFVTGFIEFRDMS